MLYVIVPIHGTWAKKASWTRPDSEFCRRMSDFLGTVVIRPFEWSGKNWHWARRVAATQLRQLLIDLSRDFPGARIILVGHSHGGNVGLMALEDTEASAKVHCLITLSTPFVSLQDRPLVSTYLRSFPMILSWAIPIILDWTLQAFGMDQIGSAMLDSGQAFLKGAIELAALSLVGVGVYRVITVLLATARRIASSLVVVPHDSLSLLVVRAGGDEASSALAAAQFAGWLVRQFWRYCTYFASSSAGFSERQGLSGPTQRLIIVNVVLLSVVAILIHFLGGGWTAFLYACIVVPVSSAFLMYMVTVSFSLIELVLVLTLVILQPVVALLMTPFGPDLSLAALISDISVEATPPGFWPLFQSGSQRADLTPGNAVFSYLHSATHDQPEIVAFICKWIQDRA